MTQNLTTMDLSEGLKYLNSMFPYLDTEIILCVLAKNLYKFEETIENLLEFQQEKKQTCKFQDNDNLFIETYNITSNTNEIKKNQLNFRLDISWGILKLTAYFLLKIVSISIFSLGKSILLRVKSTL